MPPAYTLQRSTPLPLAGGNAALVPAPLGGNAGVVPAPLGGNAALWPADGQWKSGLCECFAPMDGSCSLCCQAFLCPCLVYDNNRIVSGGPNNECQAWCCFGTTGLRRRIQMKYRIRQDSCDCCYVWFCPCCTLIQEAHELHNQTPMNWPWKKLTTQQVVKQVRTPAPAAPYVAPRTGLCPVYVPADYHTMPNDGMQKAEVRVRLPLGSALRVQRFRFVSARPGFLRRGPKRSCRACEAFRFLQLLDSPVAIADSPLQRPALRFSSHGRCLPCISIHGWLSCYSYPAGPCISTHGWLSCHSYPAGHAFP